jgi:hypothetical protein
LSRIEEEDEDEDEEEVGGVSSRGYRVLQCYTA